MYLYQICPSTWLFVCLLQYCVSLPSGLLFKYSRSSGGLDLLRFPLPWDRGGVGGGKKVTNWHWAPPGGPRGAPAYRLDGPDLDMEAGSPALLLVGACWRLRRFERLLWLQWSQNWEPCLLGSIFTFSLVRTFSKIHSVIYHNFEH